MTDTQEKIRATIGKFPDLGDWWETWRTKSVSCERETYETIRTVLQSALQRETNKAEVDEFRKETVRWMLANAAHMDLEELGNSFSDHIAQHYTIIRKGE